MMMRLSDWSATVTELLSPFEARSVPGNEGLFVPASPIIAVCADCVTFVGGNRGDNAHELEAIADLTRISRHNERNSYVPGCLLPWGRISLGCDNGLQSLLLAFLGRKAAPVGAVGRRRKRRLLLVRGLFSVHRVGPEIWARVRVRFRYRREAFE